MFPLSQLPIGKQAKIISFSDSDLLAYTCVEMGLCINSSIEMINQLPFGGNLVVLGNNGKYSLRKEDADKIMVEEI